MTKKSFSLRMVFKGELRNILFVAEDTKDAEERFTSAREEVKTLAEHCKLGTEFWPKAVHVFSEQGFMQIKR